MSRASQGDTSATGAFYTDEQSGALRSRRFRISVIAGPDAGKSVELEHGTVLVGAHASNQLALQEPGISRYHLELEASAAGLLVTDLNSTYGTFQGETRIGQITLRQPAELRLGTLTTLSIEPIESEVEVETYADDHFGPAVGGARPMRELFALLQRVAASDAVVVLEGETGTGKDLLAQGLHARSARAAGPFVVVDCGSLPRELIGSELFGHVRGAFTGASSDKRGLIVEADHGTLFLDEIGELPLDLQPQLLRVLEKREVRPVGGTQARKVDIRVVAATHRNLAEMVREGRFRADLYYRLSVVRAHVPALRERKEDVPRLVRACLAELGHDDFELTPDALAGMMAYAWPGNVRELRNVIERGISLGGVDVPGEPGEAGVATDAIRAADPLELPFKEAKGRLIDSFEREYLQHLLARHGGNVSRAAIAAKLDRNHLRLLIEKHGLRGQE
jgi:transcriptional regulator with PAS, ATPase and Fis domain